jgi:PKD repeat protein
LQNPNHTYEIPGTYQANLTITNTSYSLVSTKLVTITVYKQPVCDFSSFNTVGTAPFTTRLFDTSTNLNTGPYTYYTDFGDGNTSTEEALYYNWNITGTYDVKHCITDSVTTACNNKTAYVTVGTATIAPVASFYGSPTTGNVPLTVSFTDVSSNTPTSWNWSFGDGAYSELQNPSHIYTRSGFRTVNLTATNSAGSNVTVRLKFVRVS